MLGLPFAFAHHFSPANTLPALALYRSLFQPSPTLDHPHTMIGVSVTCARRTTRRFVCGTCSIVIPAVRTGRPRHCRQPEETAAYNYTPEERAFIDSRIATQVIGSPATVRDHSRRYSTTRTPTS